MNKNKKSFLFGGSFLYFRISLEEDFLDYVIVFEFKSVCCGGATNKKLRIFKNIFENLILN